MAANWCRFLNGSNRRRASSVQIQALFWVTLLSIAGAVSADEPESLGLKVPPGFTITKFADDALAQKLAA